jgi:N-acyl homoserine lactone hydrolase
MAFVPNDSAAGSFFPPRGMRGNGWSSLLRRRKDVEFPAFAFIVEHPEGHIAIDTGRVAEGWPVALPMRRFIPTAPPMRPGEEIGPQMETKGLRTEDVRRVVVTHLDVDHAGGIGHFPEAEFLVHRPEYALASTFLGKQRYRPQDWPSWFKPTLYDLDPEPHGPFPESKALTESGDVRLVPIPGHTIGQVGVVLRTNGVSLFFTADHLLRQDWFLDDYADGRLKGLGALTLPKRAVETSQRIHRFLEETPAILVPSHDSEGPDRLAAMEPLRL